MWKVLRIAKKGIGKIIKQDRDKDAFKNDMEFLKDQRTKQQMAMSIKGYGVCVVFHP